MELEERGPRPSQWDGPWSRLVGVLIRPRATMESIARKPSWLPPVLLLIVLGIALAFSVMHRGGWRAAIEKQAEKFPAFAQMNHQQRRQRLDYAVRRSEPFFYLGAALGPAVFLCAGLIILGAVSVILGARIKFAQYFAICAYALVPFAFRPLAEVAKVWARPLGTVSFLNVREPSLTLPLPHSTPPWIMEFLGRFDVIHLWWLVVLAVGFSAAAKGKAPLGRSLAAVFAVGVVITVVLTVYAALSHGL